MISTFLSVLILFLISFPLHRTWSWAKRRKSNPIELPYPPGPKTYPLLGNVLEMPTSHHWLKYTEWAKIYGTVFHLEVFGQHYIILNTQETCTDLFESRSAIYSDKPHSTMLCDLMNFSWFTGILSYGPVWRQHRKVLHQYFHKDVVTNYSPIQLTETRKTLCRLLDSPKKVQRSHSTVTTILKVSYGIEIDNVSHPFAKYGERFKEAMVLALTPGAFPVDSVPLLKYIPESLPGARFKRLARYYRDATSQMISGPVEFVKNELATNNGRVDNSVYAQFHKQMSEEQKTIDTAIRFEAATNAIASAYAVLEMFFLAMSMYPDIQAEAQAQIDSVISNGRLPEHSDLEKMPCIQAVVKELLRWQPITPPGSRWRVATNDFYQGYYIPKGSVIVGNVWAILHDENVYPNPYAFRPERFLNEDGSLNVDVPDPVNMGVFGFGRRICPRRFFANNGTLIMVASVLSVFDIRLPVGSDIKREDQTNLSEHLTTSGIVSYPRSFECIIEPRSTDVTERIRRFSQESQIEM